MNEVIIIGGGAAGIMSAISAARNNKKVLILDRTKQLGRKILVCGAGRCNITNIDVTPERYFGASRSFVSSIFSQFSHKDVVNFFKELGVELYEERKGKGKLFPITDQAFTITEVLYLELERLGVKIELNTEVSNIYKDQDIFVIKTSDGKEFKCKKLIMSAGGKTYPALGSDGSGYSLAQDLGHTIITPVPSALPLESDDPLCRKLQGQRWDVEVKAYINNELVDKDVDNMMFTRFGISGPVALNISRPLSVRINRENKLDCKVTINFFPGKKKEDLKTEILERIRTFPNRPSGHLMIGLLPNKFLPEIMDLLGIDPQKLSSALNKAEIRKITDSLSEYSMDIIATRGWNEAEFTAGGIDSREVDRRSLESKIIPDLHFAGEILDVDGDVGGFNLTWAWSSGFVAGLHV